MNQIHCPLCNSCDVSITTKGNMTQIAASFGGGFVEGAVKEVANGIFDGAGHIVPKFGSSLASLVPVEYVCHECDCLIKALFNKEGEIKQIAIKKSPMPEEIIEQVRDNHVQALKNKRPYISTVIFALLTVFCILNLYWGSVEADGIQIVLGLILAIPFLIVTLIQWGRVRSLNKQIDECELQSLREFKHTHRNLFNQYSQYN